MGRANHQPLMASSSGNFSIDTADSETESRSASSSSTLYARDIVSDSSSWTGTSSDEPLTWLRCWYCLARGIAGQQDEEG